MKKLNTVIARVVVRGRPDGSQGAAEHFLVTALRKWPANAKTTFLMTPGGFVSGSFPLSWSGKSSWDSPQNIKPLINEATHVAMGVFSPKVIDLAKGRVKVITLCVDLHEPDTGEHAELIAVFDVDLGKIVGWTGKSYPVPSQEKRLVQVSDLKSHVIEVAGERVLILGCHDLNMWNPRGWAAQSPGSNRRKRCMAMRRIAKKFNPTVVLQHPHDTDSPNIWSLGWGEIKRQFPNLKAWASGICYNNENGGKQRAPLKKVLARTQGGPVVNVVAN